MHTHLGTMLQVYHTREWDKTGIAGRKLKREGLTGEGQFYADSACCDATIKHVFKRLVETHFSQQKLTKN